MTEKKYKVVDEKALTDSSSTRPKKVIVDEQAVLCLLVGGPYTDNKENEFRPYGHVALRIITGGHDITYDYGRYGRTWGIGDSEGEGMLNIWTSFNEYIAAENSLGRLTKEFRFHIKKRDADEIKKHFDNKIGGKKLIRDDGFRKRYRIEDYHALKTNCTTMSIDGALIALPFLMQGSEKYNEGNGLGRKEKLAAEVAGWPKRIFMPRDLDNFLSSLSGKNAPYETKTHGKGAK